MKANIGLTSLIIVISGFCQAYGQGHAALDLSFGIKSQPSQFFYPKGKDNFKLMPVYQVIVGWRTKPAKSGLNFGVYSNYQRIQADVIFEPVVGVVDDPFLQQEMLVRDIMNLVGLKFGVGYNKSINKGRHWFSVCIGPEVNFSVLGKNKLFNEEGIVSESKRFGEHQFSKGILYGAYLKPSYEFTLGKGRNASWSLLLFLEANILWRNGVSEGNPMFMCGGGFGLSYSINRKPRRGNGLM